MRVNGKSNEGITRLVKPVLTYKLIELQQHGYEYDFILLRDYSVVCIQDKQHFGENDIKITTAENEFDALTGGFKFLFTVETLCGRKGVLLVESAYRKQVLH